MTSKQFIMWFKGFTEACNDFTATPKQWDRIKEVLNEVEDDDDYSYLDEEIDDWYPDSNIPFRPNGTNIYTQGGTITFSSGSSTSVANLPTGTNITYTTKQQLND